MNQERPGREITEEIVSEPGAVIKVRKIVLPAAMQDALTVHNVTYIPDLPPSKDKLSDKQEELKDSNSNWLLQQINRILGK